MAVERGQAAQPVVGTEALHGGEGMLGVVQKNAHVPGNLIRHDDVDFSRLANPGKIDDPNLALVEWHNHFLDTFDDGGLELRFVKVGHRDRLIRDPGCANKCRGNRKLIDDF